MAPMRLTILLAFLPGAIVDPLAAQSLQRLSVQGSGALVFPTTEATDYAYGTRLGFELQVRYTFARFSLGLGYQRSTVYQLENEDFSAAVSLGFLEPRYVVAASNIAAFYLAGRAGLGSLVCNPSEDCSEQALEVALGGGGGVLFRVSNRLAVDLGGQYFTTQYTAATSTKTRADFMLVRLGLSLGL